MDIEIIYLLLSGLVGGFLAGLLGIGGGVIYILILPLALESAGVCDPEIVKYTIANSVFAIFVASLSGNVINYFKKRFFVREVLHIGLPASILSIAVMYFIVNQPWYSRQTFNMVVLVLLVFMLIKMLIKSKGDNHEKAISKGMLGFIGGSSGVVSALSGLGGGILVVPLLQAFFKMPIKKAKDISLGVIGMMAFSLSVFNFFQHSTCMSEEFQIGLIVLPTVFTMIVGVLIGSPAGVWLAYKLKPNYLKVIFMFLILSVIIRKVMELI